MNGANSAASGKIEGVTGEWKKYELTLTSNAAASKNVTLQLTIGKGKIAVDMVSLFPEDTYKGRANGIRKDLAEKLEELKPTFLRFPGGCVIEGNNDTNAYDWKDSIATGKDGLPLLFNGTYGDVAARKQGINIWSNLNTSNDPYPSYMTYGIGFFEYFQLAEDLGAIGVPVVNCGLFCQVRGGKPVNTKSEEFQQYIQDALDLVEFCRGDETTTWGKVRVALGHPEPFQLKYIGIGNENWGSDYFTRYELFVEAFEKARIEDKPIFLSIGYSACHWCHVLAHESFEDREISQLLNQYYISIKVDKEERPDIDSVYMSVCQAFTGSGGWPTSIFMTWDQKPFFAGTYFPKTTRGGRVGMRELLLKIHEIWEHDRETLLWQSKEIVEHLRGENLG